jgi:hypothetical protein
MSTPAPASFYEQVGEHEFRTTPATESPWDRRMQHGGPPAALLARAAELARPDDSMQIARITVDMLGGIPQGRMRTEAEVVRPGKRVELIQTRLWAEDKLAVTASVWRIRVDRGLTTAYQTAPDLPDLPAEQPQRYFDGVSPDWGYGRAVEWRFVNGGFEQGGVADVWARVRIPLVAGEDTSPVCRLLVVADSMNGLSIRLPLKEWLSIPPTLNVTVQHPPVSEWMLFHAQTLIGPDGIGIARGQVEDEAGFVAEIAQPLLVQPR